MLSKNKAKHINSLKINKFRKEYREFIVEGTKSVKELLQSTIELLEIFATENWLAQNTWLKAENKIQLITQTEMERISSLASPPGILAIAKIPINHDPPKLSGSFGLVLDGINDPGNLGTIIRTADWFGVQNIIMSHDTVDPYHPKVVQATMGSVFRLRFFETDLEKFLPNARAEGITVYGAAMEGKNVYSFPLSDKSGLLVIGSESHGIRKRLIESIDQLLTIPAILSKSGQSPESLNAAIATSLILAEFRREQLQK